LSIHQLFGHTKEEGEEEGGDLVLELSDGNRKDVVCLEMALDSINIVGTEIVDHGLDLCGLRK